MMPRHEARCGRNLSDVHLEFTDEQLELRDSASAALARECPPRLVRDIAAGVTSTGNLGTALTWLGWPALTVDVDLGGLGRSFVELAIVLEEMGRAAAPGSFLPTQALFAPVVREAGTTAQAHRFLAERGRRRPHRHAGPARGRPLGPADRGRHGREGRRRLAAAGPQAARARRPRYRRGGGGGPPGLGHARPVRRSRRRAHRSSARPASTRHGRWPTSSSTASGSPRPGCWASPTSTPARRWPPRCRSPRPLSRSTGWAPARRCSTARWPPPATAGAAHVGQATEYALADMLVAIESARALTYQATCAVAEARRHRGPGGLGRQGRGRRLPAARDGHLPRAARDGRRPRRAATCGCGSAGPRPTTCCSARPPTTAGSSPTRCSAPAGPAAPSWPPRWSARPARQVEPKGTPRIRPATRSRSAAEPPAAADSAVAPSHSLAHEPLGHDRGPSRPRSSPSVPSDSTPVR